MEKIKGYKLLENKTFYITYDRQGEKIGKILKEEEKNIEDDIWLKGVTCFVINEEGKVLVEKRVNKGLTPGKIDLCSGHMDDYETPTQAMIRELGEELGIKLEEAMEVQKLTEKAIPLEFVSKGKKKNFHINFYCLKRNNSNVILQKEEIDSIKWITNKECFDLIRSGRTKFPYDVTNKDKYEEIFKKVEDIVNGKENYEIKSKD